MFFAQNCYGSQMLAEAFDRLPIPTEKRLKVTAKFLDVTERTLNDYITGKRNPPRALVYAIWHESPLGHEVTSLHACEETAIYRRLSNSLTDQVNRQQATIDKITAELADLKRTSARPGPVAMNDPVYRYR